MSFSTTELELIASAKEVTIETRSPDRVHRTVIWVAVGDETMYVRSFLGDAGRWYQRALADPDVALVVGDTRVAFRAVPATDAESIEHASEGFRRKYPKGRSLDAMVVPEVLHTTLRLEPVS
ncbi:MAG: DUF2255 family protein [Acidimicrobiia bacterium]